LGFPGRETSMDVCSCVWSEPGPFASTSSVRDSMSCAGRELREQRDRLRFDDTKARGTRMMQTRAHLSTHARNDGVRACPQRACVPARGCFAPLPPATLAHSTHNLTQEKRSERSLLYKPVWSYSCIELKRHHCLSHTVGLVVEYSPATGETRVRFPDGVPV
jgi:hypothetical protein